MEISTAHFLCPALSPKIEISNAGKKKKFSFFLFKTGDWLFTCRICSEGKLMRCIFGAYFFKLEDGLHCFLGQALSPAEMVLLAGGGPERCDRLCPCCQQLCGKRLPAS